MSETKHKSTTILSRFWWQKFWLRKMNHHFLRISEMPPGNFPLHKEECSAARQYNTAYTAAVTLICAATFTMTTLEQCQYVPALDHYRYQCHCWSVMVIILQQMGIFFTQNVISFSSTVPYRCTVLSETGLMQWIFDQHCGYWWPGHQQQQCWVSRMYVFSAIDGLTIINPLHNEWNERWGLIYPTSCTSSISWLLMIWWHEEPGHQQLWYWLVSQRIF